MNSLRYRRWFPVILMVFGYAGLFALSAWIQLQWGVFYALLLIAAVLVANVSYNVLYFVNEFRYDRVLSGRASLSESRKIQRRRRYLTWYWMFIVNASQLFVFAFLFQYFYQFGGDRYFVFQGKLGYFDWVLYTIDCTFKSILDLPEIFDLHLRNIQHKGLVGGLIVAIVRLLIYSTLATSLLRQWNKRRQLRETIDALNIAPRMAGRRLIRMGEEVLPALDDALLREGLLQPQSGKIDRLARDENSEPLIQMLLRNMQVGDEAERRNAAVLFGLLLLRDSSSQPYFRVLLQLSHQEPVPEVRAEIVRTLGKLKDSRVLPQLRRLLHDPVDCVRVQAARGIGRMKDHHALHMLSQLFTDEVQEVRIAAIKAVGQLGAKRSVSALKLALSHDDPKTRREAVFSLAFLGYEAIGRDLLALLQDDEPKARLKSIYCVRVLHPVGAVKALSALLQDNDEEVRIQATLALGELDNETACAQILAHKQDPSASVRRVQIDVMRESRNEQCLQFFEQATTDPEPLIRERAIQALGSAENEEAAEALLACLEHPSTTPEDRVNAARALGRCQQTVAYDKMVALAENASNPHLRRQAIRSMVWMGPERSIDTLVALSSDKLVRQVCVYSLIGVRDRRALPGLVRLLEEIEEPALREALWHALKQLSRRELPCDATVWREWLATEGEAATIDEPNTSEEPPPTLV